MSSTGCSAFSQDSQYFAYCGNDGKLRIWETSTSRLRQEYTPNFHLSSPCNVLEWIYVGTPCNATPPWKKRRKKSTSDENEQRGVIAMGSANGSITLYDVAVANVAKSLENGHKAGVTALTWSQGVSLFSAGSDNQIIEWNLQEGSIKCKWKSGKAKVTALAVVADGKSLVSADRVIKWWDLATKEIIHTFTGHASQIVSLNCVQIDNSTAYVISAASGDAYLGVWALSETNDKNTVATLAMQDNPVSVSVHVSEDSQIMVLAVSRSGQAHLFKYQPNGRSKPLKPSLNIAVAVDVNQKETVQQIPILSAQLTEDEKLLLAYGSYVHLTFEKVQPDFSDKIQCLVRADPKRVKEKKEEMISKVKATVIEGDVKYLTADVPVTAVKRNRSSSTGAQLPLKERLENLSLTGESNTSGRKPIKGANMALLLIQGLNSKDKTILSNVLFTKNENVIKNTIAKLPVQAIPPLLKELTIMLQGKTYPSKIAVTWLQALLTTHAAHLLSRPDIGESLSPILSLIDAKLTLLGEISKLRGRVSLVTGQIWQTKDEQDKDIMEESLLVYQDPDSSDEGAAIDEAETSSVSDENWEEMSDQEEEEEHNEEEDENEENEDVKSVKSERSDDDNASVHS